jgi:protein-S-isoprenylcysteine O-methyltransferase Ste14
MVIAAATFGVFVWGVRGHFRSAAMPWGMAALSLASTVALILFEIEAWKTHATMLWIAAGCFLHLGALILFLAAVRATRTQRITLAFDRDAPSFLVARGPYRVIRHPFYASYMIFWLGCVLVTQAASCLIAFLILSAVYVLAAGREETKFAASSLSADYESYRHQAGFLWPRCLRSSG